jgi:predicted molibdopterin-dependent oxidoreductase YjgC
MPNQVSLTIDKRAVRVAVGTTAAAAVLAEGLDTRRSVSGQARGPMCGMGVCMECRLTIDGRPHVLSCQVLCRDGMEIATDG